MAHEFAPDLLARLASAEEVEIETVGPATGTRHRTVIWVVVEPGGQVLIRTYRGPTSRWYRELLQQPECVLHLADEAIPVRAIPVTDPGLVQACSVGYVAKYAGHEETPSMLSAENMATTVQLVPR